MNFPESKRQSYTTRELVFVVVIFSRRFLFIIDSSLLFRVLEMESHRGNYQRHQEHLHSNFHHNHNEHNQFNNHSRSHFNLDSNQQMSSEVNQPFGGGGFRSNGRKRDYNDGGTAAKLYVAPIPRTMSEENIRPLFEEHGSVVEIILPWDRRNRQRQAYCFVKYATVEEADRAIRALDNQHTIHGEAVPIKVRYADGELERFGSSHVHFLPLNRGFLDKLYVGSVNKQASKQEIEEIFSSYGHVTDVYIVRDEQKLSRGCAFVKYAHRDMALAAIKALNGTFTMRGCDQPLIVRYADPKKPKIGESRGNNAFGGHNFGPCSQQPMVRSASKFGGPIGGGFSPNASSSVQQISATALPQADAPMAKQENAPPHFPEQLLPSVKQSPPQLSQMSSQCRPAFQSPQQAVFDTHKQTQNLEQQQSTQLTQQETWTGSNPQADGHTSAAPPAPSNPQAVEAEECDWSEHYCPDGYNYYYNCTTFESRWEKPVEFMLFQQEFQKQQKLHCSNQQTSLSPVCSAKEVDQTQKDVDHVQIQTETPPVVNPTCV